MGCFSSKLSGKHAVGYEDDPAVLASLTNCISSSSFFYNPVCVHASRIYHAVTVNEVHALNELYKKLSCLIIADGLIHKEEFQLALFRNSNMRNFFADRVFDMFDIKRNGVIEFGEFVRSLSIFHPSAPESEKIEFAFKLYDLRRTGFIEREELKEMVLAILNESDLSLSDELVEEIVNKTFNQADTKGDGKIDPDEWKDFVRQNPSLLKNMTLPYLSDLTISFPSFVMQADLSDTDVM